jgi:cell division protein FtsN
MKKQETVDELEEVRELHSKTKSTDTLQESSITVHMKAKTHLEDAERKLALLDKEYSSSTPKNPLEQLNNSQVTTNSSTASRTIESETNKSQDQTVKSKSYLSSDIPVHSSPASNIQNQSPISNSIPKKSSAKESTCNAAALGMMYVQVRSKLLHNIGE